MALVQYSDSDSDTAPETPPRPRKKPRQNESSTQQKSLPPLPAVFHDLYAVSTRVSVKDDPSLHGGRKRVIPHVEGNWPTHVYLEWHPTKAEVEILDDIITETKDTRHSGMTIHGLLQTDLGAQLPLHISLSRPVVLRTEQRQSFLDTFSTAIKASNIPPFTLTLQGLNWVSNCERTRWFLVLRVQKPEYDNLNRLLKVSNQSLALFGQPALYESAQAKEAKESDSAKDYSHCFHISLAWSLTEPSLHDRERIERIDLRRLGDLKVDFNCVKAKIGNNISSIPLATGISHERGLGGL